jgi:hypothetical protein
MATYPDELTPGLLEDGLAIRPLVSKLWLTIVGGA